MIALGSKQTRCNFCTRGTSNCGVSWDGMHHPAFECSQQSMSSLWSSQRRVDSQALCGLGWSKREHCEISISCHRALLWIDPKFQPSKLPIFCCQLFAKKKKKGGGGRRRRSWNAGGGLLSGGDVRSTWLRDFANIVVTPFSLIQPLFICLTFSVSTLHQDSSAPPLTQELYTHFSHKDQNIWTLLVSQCCSFCLEFSASWN